MAQSQDSSLQIVNSQPLPEDSLRVVDSQPLPATGKRQHFGVPLKAPKGTQLQTAGISPDRGFDEAMGDLSTELGWIGKSALPVVAGGAVAAPLKTAIAMGAGIPIGAGVKWLGEKLGFPGTGALAGDVSGVVAGAGAASTVPDSLSIPTQRLTNAVIEGAKATPVVRQFMRVPSAFIRGFNKPITIASPPSMEPPSSPDVAASPSPSAEAPSAPPVRANRMARRATVEPPQTGSEPIPVRPPMGVNAPLRAPIKLNVPPSYPYAPIPYEPIQPTLTAAPEMSGRGVNAPLRPPMRTPPRIQPPPEAPNAPPPAAEPPTAPSPAPAESGPTARMGSQTAKDARIIAREMNKVGITPDQASTLEPEDYGPIAQKFGIKMNADTAKQVLYELRQLGRMNISTPPRGPS